MPFSARNHALSLASIKRLARLAFLARRRARRRSLRLARFAATLQSSQAFTRDRRAARVRNRAATKARLAFTHDRTARHRDLPLDRRTSSLARFTQSLARLCASARSWTRRAARRARRSANQTRFWGLRRRIPLLQVLSIFQRTPLGMTVLQRARLGTLGYSMSKALVEYLLILIHPSKSVWLTLPVELTNVPTKHAIRLNNRYWFFRCCSASFVNLLSFLYSATRRL
mmetsp:Transcript_125469/g.313461  ORF Transcript_125469/g.313461 Transcript_125469/m.313461 type:complete len:228 (+) Transcript_125469:1216-1899(+)